MLFYTDATASLGGNPLETDARQLDAVSAGMQKCPAVLPAPRPSPSARGWKRSSAAAAALSRIRTDAHHDGVDEMIYSTISIRHGDGLLGPERLNHHTEATSALFAARECARLILREGLDNGIARHKLHGDALLKGIRAMGLETLATCGTK